MVICYHRRPRLTPMSMTGPVPAAEFDYELPEELIAQYPAPQRTGSRLLCLEPDCGHIEDRRFPELEAELRPGDVLVINDTRVVAARLFATKSTGGKVEILIERLLSERRVLAQLRASKPTRAGTVLALADGIRARVEGRRGPFFELELDGVSSVADVLAAHGHVPLPPYIRRSDAAMDRSRYQTVYACAPGAVAAPTAGLHFDDPFLARLRRRGVDVVPITLHVGSGTFQPVRVSDPRTHTMHAESVEVSLRTCERIEAARGRGGRVVAVGTTSVRALESAGREGKLRPFSGETALFIYPGFEFQVVDCLLTNFHLPRSTLLMLVCAFAGTDCVLDAYRHAVRCRYRFYSYGDAMFITGRGSVRRGPAP